MVYRYLKCSSIAMLSWIFYLASGESTSDNCITCHSKSILDCAEVIKPGWTIDKLANVTLDAWPDCLLSNTNDIAVHKLVTNSSANIFEATRRGFIGFVQYYYLMRKETCSPLYNIRGKDGKTLLQLAAENGHLSLVKYFAKPFDSNDNFLNDDIDYTKLVFLLEPLRRRTFPTDTDVEKAHVIPGLYASLEDVIFDENHYTWSPLLAAAYNGHLHIVKYLLEAKKIDPRRRHGEERALLCETASGGHLETMKYLLDEKDFSINVSDADLFLRSASSGNVDLLKFLMYEKKLQNTKKGRNSALHLAIMTGNLEAVKFFIEVLKHEPDEVNWSGLTPAHLAAQMGSLTVLKYLIDDKNVDKNVTDWYGFVPLHFAAFGGHIDIVKYLIDTKHTDAVVRSFKGYVPLQLAVVGGKIDTVKYLVDEKMADLSIQDHSGQNLLHLAAKAGNLNVLQYLIKEKKMIHQISERNWDENKTVWQCAIQFGHLDIVRFFMVEKLISVDDSLRIAIDDCQFSIVKYLVEEKRLFIESQDTSKYIEYVLRDCAPLSFLSSRKNQ